VADGNCSLHDTIQSHKVFIQSSGLVLIENIHRGTPPLRKA